MYSDPEQYNSFISEVPKLGGAVTQEPSHENLIHNADNVVFNGGIHALGRSSFALINESLQRVNGGPLKIGIGSGAGAGDYGYVGYIHGNFNTSDANDRARIGAIVEDGTGAASLWFSTGTAGAGQVERMRIRADGKVGIGTSTPEQVLDVNGNLYLRGNLLLPDDNQREIGAVNGNALKSMSVHNAYCKSIQVHSATGGDIGTSTKPFNVVYNKRIALTNGGTAALAAEQITFAYGNATDYAHSIKTKHNWPQDANNNMEFHVHKPSAGVGSTVNALTLSSTNAVGINTSSPAYNLHVVASGTTGFTNASDKKGLLITDSTAPRIILENLNAQSNSRLSTISGDGNNLNIGVLNDAGTAWTKQKILNLNLINYDATFAGHVIPETTNQKDIGTTSLRFRDIYLVNQPSVTSDGQDKKDVTPLDSPHWLSIVSKLRPVSYKLINNESDRTHTGFISQQVFEDLGFELADRWGFYVKGTVEVPVEPVQEAFVGEKRKRDETEKVDVGELLGEEEKKDGSEPVAEEVVEDVEDGVDDLLVPPTAPATVTKEVYGLRYTELIAPLVACVQELNKRILLQQEQIALLATQIAELKQGSAL